MAVTWDYGSKFELPPVWHDDDEIYSLMQTFKRRRELDTVAYDRKMNFWRDLILEYCQHHHVLVISEPGMKSVFTKKFQSDGMTCQPQCLGQVLSEISRQGLISSSSEYQSGMMSKLARSGFNWLVKKPISWSWSMLAGGSSQETSSTDGAAQTQTAEFVVTELVEKSVNEFILWVREQSTLRVLPRLSVYIGEDFDRLLTSYMPHEQSRLLLRSLLQQRQLIHEETLQDDDRCFHVVRVSPGPGLSKVGPMEVQEQSQVRGIAHLKQAIASVEGDERDLERRIEERRNEIRGLMKLNRKVEAKNLLRRTKLTEAALDQKRVQLHNMEGMLYQVESASNNRQVVSALSDAGKFLKTTGRDAEKVGDTMAEVADVLAEHKEISDSMMFNPGEDADLLELETELDDLLNEDNDGRDKRPLPPAGDRTKMDKRLAELDLSDIDLPDVTELPSPAKEDATRGRLQAHW